MASPQESITTVNGRRCTRSRARTAATSIFTTQEPAVVTPTEVTTSTTAEQAPQIQTSAVEAPPPPPPPPPPPSPAASSSTPPPAEQPAAAPSTTQAAVSSATGTISVVLTPSSPTTSLALGNVAPSEPAAAGPKGPVEAGQPTIVPSQPAMVPPATSTVPIATISDTIFTAVLPPTPNQSSRSAPNLTASGAIQSAVLQTSLASDPEQPSQVDAPSDPTSVNPPITAQPQQPTTTIAPSLPSGDAAAGIIFPDRGDPDGEGGLTIPRTGDANIGGIVGGVLGGVAGFALVCALIFFCLRKRKSREPRWIEKKAESPNFAEKVKAIPARLSVMFAKVKAMKKGPSRNPYQRHSQHDSVSSVYSTNSNGRARSISEPQGLFAGERPMRRSSSRKSERNLLRKKNGSVSSQLTFAGIVEETERSAYDPFADTEPPRVLQLSNPDIVQSPRGLLTPQPAVTSACLPSNPFASPFDHPIIALNGSVGSLPIQGHKRTQSIASALSSHPPSLIFVAPNNTVAKSSVRPPPPSQTLLPNQKRRSSVVFPTFDATSKGASRNSDFTMFGEPGPSRPGTNLFTPGIPTGRTVRQSDPFDLDRPEVLGFGNVIGRREVQASVTRQATRGKRTSSIGNWGSTADGSYQQWNTSAQR